MHLRPIISLVQYMAQFYITYFIQIRYHGGIVDEINRRQGSQAAQWCMKLIYDTDVLAVAQSLNTWLLCCRQMCRQWGIHIILQISWWRWPMLWVDWVLWLHKLLFQIYGIDRARRNLGPINTEHRWSIYELACYFKMVCRIARIEQKTQEEEYNLESVDHATKSRPAEIQPTS